MIRKIVHRCIGVFADGVFWGLWVIAGLLTVLWFVQALPVAMSR